MPWFDRWPVLAAILILVLGGAGLLVWRLGFQPPDPKPAPVVHVLDSETAQAQARQQYAREQAALVEAERQREREAQEAQIRAIRARGPQVGMSANQILDIWGYPQHEQVSKTKYGTTLFWYYGRDRSLQVVIEDSRVTSVNYY